MEQISKRVVKAFEDHLAGFDFYYEELGSGTIKAYAQKEFKTHLILTFSVTLGTGMQITVCTLKDPASAKADTVPVGNVFINYALINEPMAKIFGAIQTELARQGFDCGPDGYCLNQTTRRAAAEIAERHSIEGKLEEAKKLARATKPRLGETIEALLAEGAEGRPGAEKN
jgi:hypothetical protein